MTQRMGTDLLRDTGELGVMLDDPLDGSRRQAKAFALCVAGFEAAVADEKGYGRIGSSIEIGREPFACLGANEHGTVFLTLAANHELAALEIDVVAIEIDEFGDAESTGEEKLQDGPVADTLGGVGIDSLDQPLGFFAGEEVDLLALDSGKFDLFWGERLYIPFRAVGEEAP